MKNKRIRKFLLNAFLLTFTFLLIASCKKPKNGEYTYVEKGIKASYLSQNGGAYNLVKKGNYSNSNNVKIKNKHNKTLYIDNVEWIINGDSAIYMDNTNTSSSPNNNLTSAYSYRGFISSKKNINGTFIVVEVTHSFSNIYVDTLSGTFTYSKH